MPPHRLVPTSRVRSSNEEPQGRAWRHAGSAVRHPKPVARPHPAIHNHIDALRGEVAMSSRKIRWLGLGLLATTGAGLLALTSMMNSAFAFGDDTALVMGPSGFPVPPPTYLDAVNDLYLHLPDTSVDPLTTPEGLYPVTGVNTLPIDSSVAQGEATLNNAILQQIQDGNHVEVFGYSQSSIISSEEMSQLQSEGVSPSDVNFVLVGD